MIFCLKKLDKTLDDSWCWILRNGYRILLLFLPIQSVELKIGTIVLHKKCNKMKCPNCGETLLMTEKQGVEIDYCPNCRGVWLDRGELDKIIERSGAHYSKRENYEDDYRKYGYDDDDRNYDNQRPYKKRKSFLDDFFDFD